MKKRACTALLLALLLLGGCQQKRYATSFADVFDTLVQANAFAKTPADMDAFVNGMHAKMKELDTLYDIYNGGTGSVKTVNENAGIAPVKVDDALFGLIKFGKEWYANTGGAVNIALGPVLRLWHDAREAAPMGGAGKLPDMAAVRAAAALCNIEDVVLDEQARTVFLAKPGMALDVGAIAKGYAVERVAEALAGGHVENYLISAGGNVLARGVPQDGRTAWGVGLQDPGGTNLPVEGGVVDVLFVTNCSVVSSGDYQRYYTVDGVRMNHIIDPATLMPAQRWRCVTVIAKDSGVADALSTALFILPLEEGKALAARYGAEAVWMTDDELIATDGAKAVMRGYGATNAEK